MSKDLPSVIGFRLDRARQILAEAGGQIAQITPTGPPGADQQVPDGRWRVVQQRPKEGTEVGLVVAQEIQLEANSPSP